jgi:hypothetical protein
LTAESLNCEHIPDFGHNSSVRIRPINFSRSRKDMPSNLHHIISKNYLAIHSRYDILLASLRTAHGEELNHKKEQTSYDHLLDALRLSLKAYNFQ